MVSSEFRKGAHDRIILNNDCNFTIGMWWNNVVNDCLFVCLFVCLFLHYSSGKDSPSNPNKDKDKQLNPLAKPFVPTVSNLYSFSHFILKNIMKILAK